MAIYSIHKVQVIPARLTEVWDFFSNPANLHIITPPYMKFKVLSNNGEKIFSGQRIEYTVRPLLGIPMYWLTEIKDVREGEYFMDEQLKGPFSLWQHQHHFKETDAGVEMTDIVHYRNPGWLIGDLANTLFLRKQLNDLFLFRQEKITTLFPIE